jgi:hypothetical protein
MAHVLLTLYTGGLQMIDVETTHDRNQKRFWRPDVITRRLLPRISGRDFIREGFLR